MLTRCLHCYQTFPRNQTLEHFGIGRRIAFDPEHGRLWAVCPACYRWTLAPFEERWEALEQLERLSTGRARLLVKSDKRRRSKPFLIWAAPPFLAMHAVTFAAFVTLGVLDGGSGSILIADRPIPYNWYAGVVYPLYLLRAATSMAASFEQSK